MVFFTYVHSQVAITQRVAQGISSTPESYLLPLQGGVTNCPDLSWAEGFFQDTELPALTPRRSWEKLGQAGHSTSRAILQPALKCNHYSDFYLAVIFKVRQMTLMCSQGQP